MICCLLLAVAALTGLSLVRPMQAVGLSPATAICCRSTRRRPRSAKVAMAVVAFAGITTALAVHTINRDAGHIPGPICSALNSIALPTASKR